eukprot:309513-Pelagomonas_calceolata.AAC.1
MPLQIIWLQVKKGGQIRGEWVFPTARTEGVRGNVRGSCSLIASVPYGLLFCSPPRTPQFGTIRAALDAQKYQLSDALLIT